MLIKGFSKTCKIALSMMLIICLVAVSLPVALMSVAAETADTTEVVFEDNFDRADGEVGNNWVIGSRANASISNNTVLLNTTSKHNWETGEQGKAHVGSSALVRPQTEAKLNQIVSADFKINYDSNKPNIGGAVIARCQDETASDANCYRAYVRLGYDGNDNTHYDLVLQNTSGNIYRSYTTDLDSYKSNGIQSGVTHRLTLKVESISSTETRLTVGLYAIDDSGTAVWKWGKTVIDSDPNLQSAGTAGFSLYEYWGMTMTVDNFSYQTFETEEVPETPISNDVAFSDNFDREDGYVANNWMPWMGASGAETNVIVNNQLKVIDTSNNNGVCTRTLERPMSTAGAINQYVSVEIHNLGSLSNYSTANIHLRNIHTKYNNEVHTGTSGPDQSYYVQAAYDHIQIRMVKSNWTTTAISEQVKYNYIFGHIYRVEFTAQGQYPTKLTATLYDVTADNTAVATVSAEDSTALLQRYGTVALSCTKNSAGQDYALFDNFEYKQADTIICNDTLIRTDATLGNDWNVGSLATTSFNENGELQLTTNHNTNGTTDYVAHIEDSALMRPISEASLNQVLSIDFKPLATTAGTVGQGPTLIARCQSDRPTTNNCYSARLFASDGSNLRLWIYRGDTLISDNSAIYTTGGMPIDKTFRLQFSAISISESATKLVATVYNINDENVPIAIKTVEVIDSTPELQKSGTVGISVYDKYNVKGWFNNFKYSSTEFVSAPTTYRFLETEYNAYGNNYNKAKDTDAYDSVAYKQTEDVFEAIAYEDIANSLNQNSAFIAYPIYAATAGDYSLKLRFKMGADDATSLANSNPYAAMVVNDTATKFMFTAQSGEYCISAPVTVNLNEGVNMLYFMAPTSEIVDVASGAYIDYDSIISERGLSAAAGSFSLPGDANSDGEFNIIDLVRAKKYVAGCEVTIDRFAADLASIEGKVIINAADLSEMRKIFLGVSTENKTLIRFVNSKEINPLAVITEEVGGADAEATAKKQAILTASDLTPTATTYYVSSKGSNTANGTSSTTPWDFATFKNNVRNLKSGDTVLFERGSVFCQSEVDTDAMLTLKSGVSYGAYGDGAKPRFYGSSMNYADATWESVELNVWKTTLDIGEGIDAGIIVFDNGSSIGVKKSSLEELTSGNDFYHDDENGVLYLYSEIGSPTEIYNDIEIGLDRYVFVMNDNYNNIKIDNIDIRYVGSHAIRGNYGNENIVITNCDISFVGGSVQDSSATGVRYGNAIEFYDEVSDITVDNCWIHQVYDAGLTFQCAENNTAYSNIKFTNNLLQYCNYSIEFFIGSNANAPGELMGIEISGNIMQFAGFGVCEQRPSTVDSAHICGWVTNVGEEYTDVTITNNTFDIANYNIVNWHWDGDANRNIKVSGNTYFMKPSASSNAMNFSNATQKNASDQETLVEAISTFDSNPKAVTWLIG